MGQQQLAKLKQDIKQGPHSENLARQSSLDFLMKVIEFEDSSSSGPMTIERIQEHLTLHLQELSQSPPQRRRSYEQLHHESTVEEEKIATNARSEQCRVAQEQMDWLEEMEQEVRSNVTQIMSTQKVFKIRQKFRKLVLKLLKIQNLLIYILYQNGRLEFHDFRNNYITDILEIQKVNSMENIISLNKGQPSSNISELFGIIQEAKTEPELYSWCSLAFSEKYKVCYAWKSHKEIKINQVKSKIMEKIISICLISSAEDEENIIIKNYSKDLLDTLELFIGESQTSVCAKINSKYTSLHEMQQWIVSTKDKSYDSLVLRINSFQQLQYEQLQRIRMYKKYVCESDKIFLDFNDVAELAFISNNFSHSVTDELSKLHDRHKLYIENIFKDNKSINSFLKKALQQKVKNNKLYQLDFQTKARVKFDGQGRILRLHVIIEQLENTNSNHSSSNIYISSSNKILSDSDKKSDEDSMIQNSHQLGQSLLIKKLEKQNPGIVDEGWINLFIKDHHMPRRNTHLKHKTKGGKSYTVKRSCSLNKGKQEQGLLNEDKTKQKDILPDINTQSIDLNLLQMDDELLEPLTIKVFKKLQYFNEYNIERQYFQNFLSQIHNGYQVHNNPFHNFTHGVNVMHTCYLLSNSANIKQILTPFKMFTIVFSGLCHDVGHTGFTNLFEIASRSKKAVTYNDSSPLQNFHASTTFQLLRKPENNFLKNLSSDDFKDFRKSVISNILYTDIKEHFPLIKKFNGLIKEDIPKNQQYISTLSAMIVHTSDFGGSAKEFEICKEWSLKVNLEFSNQYKTEADLGLPQTPFMKDLTNISVLSKNESGFLKVIVLPLYEALDEFNGTDFNMKRLRQYVEFNIKEWQRIQVQSQAAKNQS